MKVERVETLRADAGWRMFSYLKITTTDGITGWSEFNESFGSAGLAEVIEKLVASGDWQGSAPVRSDHRAASRHDPPIPGRHQSAGHRGH